MCAISHRKSKILRVINSHFGTVMVTPVSVRDPGITPGSFRRFLFWGNTCKGRRGLRWFVQFVRELRFRTAVVSAVLCFDPMLNHFGVGPRVEVRLLVGAWRTFRTPYCIVC